MDISDRLWKKIDSIQYFSNLNIPDTWATLEDFVDWYLDARMPLMIPWNAEVIQSDDAAAICIFRKDCYQVELYLEYPNWYIAKHSHPGVEVLTLQLGGGSLSPKIANGTSITWGDIEKKLLPGEEHGGDKGRSLGNGFAMLAFQRWYNKDEMSSAAIQWKGPLQGPIQEKLIREHKDNVLIKPGYADVSSVQTKD